MGFKEPRKISVYLVGPGLVGGTLLDQIQKRKELLRNYYGVEIQVVAIANRRRMHFDPDGIDLANWRPILSQSSQPMNWESFLEELMTMQSPFPVFVDCTSDQTIANSKFPSSPAQ